MLVNQRKSGNHWGELRETDLEESWEINLGLRNRRTPNNNTFDIHLSVIICIVAPVSPGVNALSGPGRWSVVM